jgi:hypothetical protein
MRIPMNAPESWRINMGINLCRRDAGVAEQFLNNPKIGTMTEHVGCKGVS